jgi:hypothetical protein
MCPEDVLETADTRMVRWLGHHREELGLERGVLLGIEGLAACPWMPRPTTSRLGSLGRHGVGFERPLRRGSARTEEAFAGLTLLIAEPLLLQAFSTPVKGHRRSRHGTSGDVVLRGLPKGG